MLTARAAQAMRPLARCNSLAVRTRLAAAQRGLSARSAVAEAGAGPSSSGRPTWDIKMLYDGECALCMKEVNFLKTRNQAGKVEFVDIAAPTYDPADNAGITFQQAMERIHAITADGRIVVDVEVFRLLYEAVGLGWVYALTKNESVLNAANNVYAFWAKYRTQITGREALGIILEKRRLMDEGKASCREVAADGSAGACELPQPVSSGVAAGRQQ